MSRRPASCLSPLVLAAFSGLALPACGSSSREAPEPPPIAVSRPAPRASPTPAPAPGGEPASEPPSTPDAESAGSKPPSTAGEANARPVEQPADALRWMRDGEARRADYARRLQEAQDAADAASKSVVERESILLAFKNAFRPRPQLAPEDAQAVSGMSGEERVRWAEGRLDAANAELSAATKRLDDIEAHPPLN